MKLTKLTPFILLVLIFTLSVNAFLINDDFTDGINPAVYNNKSVFNALNIYTSDQGLIFNGTNSTVVTCQYENYGTYLKSKYSISANDNGFYSQTFKSNSTVGNNPRVFTIIGNTTNGLILQTGGTPDKIYSLNNGTAVICSGDYKTLDNSTHTYFVNITRTTNTTVYKSYWDGVEWCTFTQSSKPPVSFEIQDFTCGTAGSVNGVNHKFIYSNIQFSDYNYTVNCPANPDYPVFAEDDFNYVGEVDSCYWFPTPVNHVSTFNNKLCYDATGTSETFYHWLQGQNNKYSAPVFTEEFTLYLNNNSYFEKSLDFLIGDGGLRKSYVLDFFTVGGVGSVSYNVVVNGSTYSQSLCSDCFDVTTGNGVKIISYGKDATGQSAFNSSSGGLSNVQVNTYSLQINGLEIFFNLPILESSPDGSNIPGRNIITFSGGYGCIDDYTIYSGLDINAEPITQVEGVPFLNIGERCAANWNCFTGFCNFLSECDKKSFGATCSGNFECVSGKCAGGFCTKASLWQNVDAIKTNAGGSDTNSNNMIALIVALVLGIALAGGLAYMGAGIVAIMGGGAVFFIALVFFTIVGWLSPFILIAAIIVLVLLFALVILIKSGG
jgi:hypothetical protein